ncbi:MAG: hypothetical protein A2293_01995 [Elusimicrobia bacterium RIFOXYB2_FULL_49_7]|nr:MAG: hypothetical protein A2293_01995 [Elusimicrobia bacterium RIFOXYB2_FULL_49_7]
MASLNTVLGTLAMTVSIIYLCFGLPLQIIKNFKRKSTEGFSFIFALFFSFSIGLWVLYAWTKTPREYYILISNLPGFILSLVLLFQFWLYRKRRS